MPVLPIPLVISLLLFGLLLHRLATRETHVTLLALIAVCAVQSAIIALVQYYGFAVLRPLQALMATTIPAIAWYAFRHATGAQNTRRTMSVHAAAPLLALVFILTQTYLLDVLIPLLFAGYGVAMLLHLARGEESLPHSRLESGNLPVLAWRILAVSLLASAACDVMIAYQLATGSSHFRLWLPSIVSSMSLLSLGVLSLSHAMESQREDDAESSINADDEARDLVIVAQLDVYVQVHKPYLDPDLTLTRLSRKLIIPAKHLSAAINRVKGENLSRFVNRLRIDNACKLLAGGASVTNAMLESGFNTKSNFNREFLRVKGKSPSLWVNSQQN